MITYIQYANTAVTALIVASAIFLLNEFSAYQFQGMGYLIEKLRL